MTTSTATKSMLVASLIFLSGVATGAIVGSYTAKKKYQAIADDEIQQIRDYYKERTGEQAEEAKEKLDESREKLFEFMDEEAKKPPVNKELKEMATKILKEESYVAPPSEEEDDDEEEPEEKINPEETTVERIKRKQLDIPYVIAPAEYGENDYEEIELTYYAEDDVLTEGSDIVDDPDELIGDALTHFGEYEDDTVFVRNDAKRCDYAILLDPQSYADVIRSNHRR